jgi:hypothetical protein
MSDRADGTEGGPGHERLAELCRRLTSTGQGSEPRPDLGPEARRLIASLTEQLRGGRSPEELEDSFDALEELFLAAGYTAGLGSYRTTAPPSYQRLPGSGQQHAWLYALGCPGGRCARVEAPEPDADEPATCVVFDRPLREIGLRQ